MSNETLKVSQRKTKLGLRRFAYILLAALTLLVAFAAANVRSEERGEPRALMGGQAFQIEVMNTPEKRMQGLSGRESLEPNHAMVFVFPENDIHCFWMKEMNFPVDMVWLDAKQQVVHIQEGVRPETYPMQFCPPSQSRYVVEYMSGMTEAIGLEVGDRVDIRY